MHTNRHQLFKTAIYTLRLITDENRQYLYSNDYFFRHLQGTVNAHKSAFAVQNTSSHYAHKSALATQNSYTLNLIMDANRQHLYSNAYFFGHLQGAVKTHEWALAIQKQLKIKPFGIHPNWHCLYPTDGCINFHAYYKYIRQK